MGGIHRTILTKLSVLFVFSATLAILRVNYFRYS